MKRLHIAFSAINDMFKLNKALFIIMVIGLLASTYMLVYSYGNISAYNNIYGIEETSTLFYFDLFNAQPLLTPQDIYKLDFDKYDFKYLNVINQHAGSWDENKNNLRFVDVLDGKPLQTEQYSWYEITAYIGNEFLANRYDGRVQFEGEADKYSVIMPATDLTVKLEYNEETDSFGTIYIYGLEFKIIGITHASREIIITWEAFEELGLGIEYLEFNTAELVDPETSEEISNYVLDTFSYAKPQWEVISGFNNRTRPHEEQAMALDAHTQGVVTAFYIYLASLIAFAFFIDFFTEKSMKRYSISILCGATKKRLVETMLLQNMILSVGSLALMIPPNLFFSKEINFFANVKYAFVDIGLMLLTVIVSTVVLSIPAVFKICKSSAADLGRAVM